MVSSKDIIGGVVDFDEFIQKRTALVQAQHAANDVGSYYLREVLLEGVERGSVAWRAGQIPLALTKAVDGLADATALVRSALPANIDPFAIPDGRGGRYDVSRLYSFGDRLSDTGNTAALEKSLGQQTPLTSPPFSPSGSFSDGPNWTKILSASLSVQRSGQQTNFAYESATARPIPNPSDPNQDLTDLSDFEGQIRQFEDSGQRFSPDDLVTVAFGDYDLLLSTNLPPDEGIRLSVDAILSGLHHLADLGAQHFLVANLRFVSLAPPFGDPALDSTFEAVYGQFNAALESGLQAFQASSALDVKELDLNALFNDIVASPAEYGFNNVTEPVLSTGTAPGTITTYNPAIDGQNPSVEYASLTLDPVFDPTARGQFLIAQTARDTLAL